MKLHVNGSSSKGNNYILESSSEQLLLEAGVRLRQVTSEINPDKPVVGLCCSHEAHGDHGKYLQNYLDRFGCDKLSSENAVEGDTYTFGEFRVTPFEVYHDVKCFGFLVYHKEMGTLFFATDTYALPYSFQKVNVWLMESNYDDDILEQNLENGVIDRRQYDRVVTSHMSLDNCINNLRDGHAEKSTAIVLIHLSARNSDAKMFKNRVEETFGAPTYIASKGLTLDISKV